MNGEEGKGCKVASEALETSNQEAMPATPRIRIRSDLFSENKNSNVVQNMILTNQLESLAGKTGSVEEDEVEIVQVVEGNVVEEGEMNAVLEKRVFGEFLPKSARRSKPARRGLSERLILYLMI